MRGECGSSLALCWGWDSRNQALVPSFSLPLSCVLLMARVVGGEEPAAEGTERGQGRRIPQASEPECPDDHLGSWPLPTLGPLKSL